MREPADAVTDYVEALDPDHRRLFDRIHALIVDAIPDSVVTISYQIPIYRVGRLHVGLNAHRRGGVTLTTTSPDHIAEFKRRHPGFRTGRASIQFDFGDDLPEDDIRDVIRRATTARA